MPIFSELHSQTAFKNLDLPSHLSFHCGFVSLKQLDPIFEYFGSFEAALEASESHWKQANILTERQIGLITSDERGRLVEEALRWGAENNQAWLPLGDKAYPELLSSIDDAPLMLSARGDVRLLNDPQIAIVGSRHASKQGINTAQDFASHLSKQGLTITSGLALGVDAAAHKGGLQGLGKTIAVVATGLDRIYPAANQTLGRQIAEEGVMVSEFPLGTKPLAFHFPRRNRIISGLSAGTLVVEAALKSGSLITAKTALNQGREVFAVPGSIHNPQAKGCHQLIKQGAKLVESGQDVLEELSALIQLSLMPEQTDLFGVNKTATVSLSAQETKVLAHVGYDPIGLDELVVVTKMPLSDIQSQLILLELSGAIEALSAGRWRRLN